MLDANAYAAEQVLIDKLRGCALVCDHLVTGVPDYYSILEAAKYPAIYVMYHSSDIRYDASQDCCGVESQVWVVAVLTKNNCQLKNGAPARAENGKLTAQVVACLRELCGENCQNIKRVTAPALPIPFQANEYVVTLLAYQVEILF